jgi:3-methylcrotonyl-CoA carboxylase alpha subunit
MIAKVIVWDETRIRAIQKMRQTLSETVVFGLHTNIPLLQKILSHEEFISGTMTTRFFETYFSKPLEAPSLGPSELIVVQSLSSQLKEMPAGSSGAAAESDPWSHLWSRP